MTAVGDAAVESGEVFNYSYQIVGGGYEVTVENDEGDWAVASALSEAEAYGAAKKALDGKKSKAVSVPLTDDEVEAREARKAKAAEKK